jgi:hypothetical protein
MEEEELVVICGFRSSLLPVLGPGFFVGGRPSVFGFIPSPRL